MFLKDKPTKKLTINQPRESRSWVIILKILIFKTQPIDKFFEPFKDSILIKVIIAIITFLMSLVSNAQVEKTSELYKTLQSKDSIIFERAFNKCESEN